MVTNAINCAESLVRHSARKCVKKSFPVDIFANKSVASLAYVSSLVLKSLIVITLVRKSVVKFVLLCVRKKSSSSLSVGIVTGPSATQNPL